MIDIANYTIDSERGFLPGSDPLQSLPSSFAEWEELGAELPKLLVTDSFRSRIKSLQPLTVDSLSTVAELERAMMLLSFIGHGYVWQNDTVPTSIPKGLAIPWYALSVRLGRPPVLSYPSYSLHNWKRINPHGPIELGNIVLLQNFWGGVDEEWFILPHVEIEAEAAAAVVALPRAQQAVADDDTNALTRELETVSGSIKKSFETLCRMPEYCDPYIYYNRVRPFIHGWKQNPALPDGMIYEGVPEYGGAPQLFRGETGSQSSIVPSLDAALGIEHVSDVLKAHLDEMRIYMTPSFKQFIEALEAGPSIRKFIKGNLSETGLRDSYNDCIHWLTEFRSKHVEYAADYIDHQNQRGKGNPTKVGTGGTPFLQYLKKHRDETSKFLL